MRWRRVFFLGWRTLVRGGRFFWNVFLLHFQEGERVAGSVSTGRRAFLAGLKTALPAMTGMMLAPVSVVRAFSEKKPATQTPHKWGMAIDLDLCTGCGGCVVACKTENNIPITGAEERDRGTGIFWMDLLPGGVPVSEEQDMQAESMPMPCMQCDDPPCVKVCPVGATYQTAEGITAQIYDRCIGCRYCEVACPYSRRYFNWSKPDWPTAYRRFLNPDVSTRPKGVVEKCNFCAHRIQRAKEEARLADRPLRGDSLAFLPACAEACPTKAITFGDRNDKQGRLSRLARESRVFRLLEHLGTRPKVFYLRRDKRRPL